MLERLLLENLVLVDSTEVHFSKGFTVITGETGSGKSILLTAIGLLLGDKADSGAIRHGEEIGIIEGDFSLPETSAISALFEEFNLDLPKRCTIKRELFASGKSRATIDSCVVPISFLKRLGAELLEISSQHAHLVLQEENAPQKVLDKFTKLEESVQEFKELFQKSKTLSDHLDKLLQEEPLKALEMERIRAQLEEIEESKIFETDDTALFSRLKEMESAKEIFEKASLLIEELDEGKDPLIRRLARLEQKTDVLRGLSPRFAPCAELIESASAALKELFQNVQSSLDTVEYSEEERTRVEEALKKIDSLKRKYGQSIEEVQKVQTKLLERLAILEGRDEAIESVRKELDSLKSLCNEKATMLHEKRSRAIPSFEKEVLSFLHLLHMPEALFHVELQATERTTTGDDKVRFFLTPNEGEKRIEVKDGASGGEMARLFLAVQAVMAHLSSIPTIIFDEIDASIGGITASSVGDLLSAIGRERQVLAITHFTQVAAKAKDHITLSKETTDGRTLTKIRRLSSKKELAEEHKRMVGKHSGPS